MMLITKRDGRIVQFERSRITNAISKAMKECDSYNEGVAEKCTAEVEKKMASKENWNVNEIQELVEEQLMVSDMPRVARAYIIYRNKRDKIRNSSSNDVILDIIAAKKTDVTRENANSDSNTPAGMMMKIASERSKEFVDDFLLTEEAHNAVNANLLHIHDKDYYPSKSATCVSSRTIIKIRKPNGEIITTPIPYLDKYFNEKASTKLENVVPDEFLWVMGRNGWTKITGISRHILAPSEKFYKFVVENERELEVTGNHLIPVLDSDVYQTVLKKATNINEGDILLSPVAYDGEHVGEDYINVLDALSNCTWIDNSDIIISNAGELRNFFNNDADLLKSLELSNIDELFYKSADCNGVYSDCISVEHFKEIERTYNLPLDIINQLEVRLSWDKTFLPLYFPVSVELAKLAGYFYGGKMRFEKSQEGGYYIEFDTNDEVEKIFKKIFPAHIYFSDRSKKQVFSELVTALFWFIGDVAEDDCGSNIPFFVSEGSKEIKLHYLSALVDTNSLRNHEIESPISIPVASVCHGMLLSKLIDSLNISSHCISRQHELGGQYETHELVISSQNSVKRFINYMDAIKFSETNSHYAAKPSSAIRNQYLVITSKEKLPIEDEVVYDLETVEHWWIANGFVVHNCLQHPIDKILSKGFRAGHGESRPAKRIETASILGCISMEQVQNEMHGGQAIPAFDFYLAPYVRSTYIEEIEKLEKLTGANYSTLKNVKIDEYKYEDVSDITTPFSPKHIMRHAINATVERVHQAMEAFVHNMNTIHSRGGNQVVFSSINYGTDTSAEGRCVIRELLKTTYRGVGNGATAIFPIGIMKLKDGVNKKPGDPNYDLFQYACKVTAKRFFPNFLNLDATFNRSDKWNADDPKRYEHEVATMGCVDGKEVITWEYKGKGHTTSFEKFWELMKETHCIKQSATEGYDDGEFMDLHGVQIKDFDGFVDCLRVIKNPDHSDWMRITLHDGYQLTVTSDHPWSIKDKGVVLTKDLHIGDMVLTRCSDVCQTMSTKTGDNYVFKPITEIKFIGHRGKCSYDVTTSSEHFVVSGIRSHNCRTRVFEDRFGEDTSVGRGNLSFSTMNLPGLALSVMDEKVVNIRLEKFFARLRELIWITGRQLYNRYQFQCTAFAKQFPLLMSGMWVGSENLKPEDEVRPVLKHGTLGIGFIGLAECLIALIGKHHGESSLAQDLGLRIVKFIRDEVKRIGDSYDLNYSVLATPAEGLSGKFVKKDKRKYGLVPGVTDKDYYTNSNHVPVYYKCSADHKAKIEAPYHDLTRGGHIFYVELDGDATHNVQAVMDVVKLMDKYNIGYGSINHTRNRCIDCGYEDASNDLTECPVCGSKNIDRLQRITGYLVGTTDRWNSGKLAELNDRVTHN